ncbi:MAG: hypothetical protein HZB24_10210 [Desulfobacterales bacterium]|nr:hypothetical protein [Desulfobacterales bacterium]
MKANELEERIVESLANGYIPAYPDKKVFKAASSSVQAAFVKNTLSWFKTYTETDAFKTDYANQRASAKPSPPESKGTVDAQYTAFLDKQRQDVEKTKQDIAKMPPDMQKQMQAVVKQMEDNIEKTAKDPQMAAIMKQSYEQEGISAQKDYQDRLATWEKKYPEDSKMLIAGRLHQFLEVSQNIPFGAELVQKGKLMKFADPQFEAQTAEWKLCYRAGREPVQAARAFVGEWLSQIEKK